MQTEKQLHKEICRYISLKYPKVLFNSDMAGIKLTTGQAIQASKLRSNKGFPDLAIYEPRGGYCGLFIELKKEGTVIIKKNGEMTSDDHILEQFEIINRLLKLKYYACFCVGFDSAIEIIDQYMSFESLIMSNNV